MTPSSAAPVEVRTGQEAMLQAGIARRGLSAFFLVGLISACLGALLPAWRHHIQPDYLLISACFLMQNVGMLVAFPLAPPVLRRLGVRSSLIAGALLAGAGFVTLALFSPPLPFAGRLAGLLLTGLGWGLLQVAVFHAVARAYRMHPAATLNVGGILYGLGCLTAALLVGSTFFDWSVLWILLVMASIPLSFAWMYSRMAIAAVAPAPEEPSAQVLQSFRNPRAILFSLLLFLQFGNEGALAGWLALFLTLRLGISPATAISLLALYWFALTLGRVIAQWLLPRLSHTRLLFFSVFLPMFGCLILAMTNNLFGAITGVLMAGGGFAVVIPLVLEKVGHRFPYFHPAAFNGIFSVAFSGALLAPASLGVFAHLFGSGVVMGLPLAGSILVFLLVSLMLLEARLSGARQ